MDPLTIVQDPLSENTDLLTVRATSNKRTCEEMCDLNPEVFILNKIVKTSEHSKPQSSNSLNISHRNNIQSYQMVQSNTNSNTKNILEGTGNLCNVTLAFSCPACNLTVLDEEKLLNHISSFHCDLNYTKLCNNVPNCRKKVWHCLACTGSRASNSMCNIFDNNRAWKNHVAESHINKNNYKLMNGIVCIKLTKSTDYICDFCEARLSTQLKLFQHFKTKHTHVDINNLSSHFKIELQFKFACSSCFEKSGYSSYFDDAVSLTKHTVTFHSKSTNSSLIASIDQNIPDVICTDLKYKKHKHETVPTCRICNRIFFNRYSLDGHVQNDHCNIKNATQKSTRVEYWKCNLCRSDSKYYLINFTDYYSFDEHIVQCHPSFKKFKRHIPEICQYPFADRNSKYLLYFAKKVLVCSGCHLSFKSLNEINYHITNDNPSEAIRNIVSVVVCHTCWELWCCIKCPKYDGVEAIFKNFDGLYAHLIAHHNYHAPINGEDTEYSLQNAKNISCDELTEKSKIVELESQKVVDPIVAKKVNEINQRFQKTNSDTTVIIDPLEKDPDIEIIDCITINKSNTNVHNPSEIRYNAPQTIAQNLSTSNQVTSNNSMSHQICNQNIQLPNRQPWLLSHGQFANSAIRGIQNPNYQSSNFCNFDNVQNQSKNFINPPQSSQLLPVTQNPMVLGNNQQTLYQNNFPIYQNSIYNQQTPFQNNLNMPINSNSVLINNQTLLIQQPQYQNQLLNSNQTTLAQPQNCIVGNTVPISNQQNLLTQPSQNSTPVNNQLFLVPSNSLLPQQTVLSNNQQASSHNSDLLVFPQNNAILRNNQQVTSQNCGVLVLPQNNSSLPPQNAMLGNNQQLASQSSGLLVFPCNNTPLPQNTVLDNNQPVVSQNSGEYNSPLMFPQSNMGMSQQTVLHNNQQPTTQNSSIYNNNPLILLQNNVSQSQVASNYQQPFYQAASQSSAIGNNPLTLNLQNPDIGNKLPQSTSQISLLKNNQQPSLQNNQNVTSNSIVSNNYQQLTPQISLLKNNQQPSLQNNQTFTSNSIVSNNYQQLTPQISLLKNNQQPSLQNNQTFSLNPMTNISNQQPTPQISLLKNNQQFLLQNNQTCIPNPNIRNSPQRSLLKNSPNLKVNNKYPLKKPTLSNSFAENIEQLLKQVNNKPSKQNSLASNDQQNHTTESSVTVNDGHIFLENNVSRNITSNNNVRSLLKSNQLSLEKPGTSQKTIPCNIQNLVSKNNKSKSQSLILGKNHQQTIKTPPKIAVLKGHQSPYVNLPNIGVPIVKPTVVNTIPNSTSANQGPSHKNSTLTSCDNDTPDKIDLISSKILTSFNILYMCLLCKANFSKCCELVKHLEVIHFNVQYSKIESNNLDTVSETFECKGCKKNKNTVRECIKHMLHCSKLINITANIEQLIKVKTLRFHCRFCSCDFENLHFCNDHMLQSHKSKWNKVQHLNINPKLTYVYKCKHCSKRYLKIFKNIDKKIEKRIKIQGENLKKKELNTISMINTAIKVEPVGNNDVIIINDADDSICNSNNVSSSSPGLTKTNDVTERKNQGVKHTEMEFMSDLLPSISNVRTERDYIMSDPSPCISNDQIEHVSDSSPSISNIKIEHTTPPLPTISNVTVKSESCDIKKKENIYKVVDLKLTQLPKIVLMRLNLKPEHFSGKPIMLNEFDKIKTEKNILI